MLTIPVFASSFSGEIPKRMVCDMNGCSESETEGQTFNTPGELIGLNVYSALQLTTGAAPGRSEILKITTTKNGVIQHGIRANYEKYRRVQASNELKLKDAYKFKCWKSYISYQRSGGPWRNTQTLQLMSSQNTRGIR